MKNVPKQISKIKKTIIYFSIFCLARCLVLLGLVLSITQHNFAQNAGSETPSIFSDKNSAFYPLNFRESFTEEQKIELQNRVQRQLEKDPRFQLNKQMGFLLESHPQLTTDVDYLLQISKTSYQRIDNPQYSSLKWLGDLDDDGSLSLPDLFLYFSYYSFFGKDSKQKITLQNLKDDWHSWMVQEIANDSTKNLEWNSDIQSMNSLPDTLHLSSLGKRTDIKSEKTWKEGPLGIFLRQKIIQWKRLRNESPLTPDKKLELENLNHIFLDLIPLNAMATSLNAESRSFITLEQQMRDFERVTLSANGLKNSSHSGTRFRILNEKAPSFRIKGRTSDLFQGPFSYFVEDTLDFVIEKFQNTDGSYLNKLILAISSSDLSNIVQPVGLANILDNSERLMQTLTRLKDRFHGTTGYHAKLNRVLESTSDDESLSISDFFETLKTFGTLNSGNPKNWPMVPYIKNAQFLIDGINQSLTFTPGEVVKMNPYGLSKNFTDTEFSSLYLKNSPKDTVFGLPLKVSAGIREVYIAFHNFFSISRTFFSSVKDMPWVQERLPIFSYLEALETKNYPLLYQQSDTIERFFGATSEKIDTDPYAFHGADVAFDSLEQSFLSDKRNKVFIDSYLASINEKIKTEVDALYIEKSSQYGLKVWSEILKEFPDAGSIEHLVLGQSKTKIENEISIRTEKITKLLENRTHSHMDQSEINKLVQERDILMTYQGEIVRQYVTPLLTPKWGKRFALGASAYRDEVEGANPYHEVVLANKKVREEKEKFVQNLLYPTPATKNFLKLVLGASGGDILKWDLNNNGIPADSEDLKLLEFALNYIVILN